MKMRLFTAYGGMKPGTYEVVAQNYDHNVIKWQGHNICVPLAMFEYVAPVREYDDDDDEDEDDD